jgi:hypothetical protein
MHLLVGYYEDSNPQRQQEYLECLRRNAAHDSITRIAVFIEDASTLSALRRNDPVFGHEKIRLIPHRRRLTYSHLFGYANEVLAGCGVIVANADIFFDETLALLEDVPLSGRLLCLSRWDEVAEGQPVHFDQPNSQDAWIFQAPAPKITGEFPLGVPGCDSRIAYEANQAGLTLCNPSRSIRARHLHLSRVHHYTQRDRLSGPVLFVPCSFLETPTPDHGWSRPPETDFPSHRGRALERFIDDPCREVEALFERRFGGVATRELRRELRRAAARRAKLPFPKEMPLASIEFREPMGYSISRLQLDASTHNNDPRPLVFIPPELQGLQFTQVVADHSTPVEIRFRTEGKVFVLAAPGWSGYALAATFLDDAGWREPMEAIRARDGTAFEVWSLVGTPHSRLVVPSQVMLAGQDLVRLDP